MTVRIGDVGHPLSIAGLVSRFVADRRPCSAESAHLDVHIVSFQTQHVGDGLTGSTGAQAVPRIVRQGKPEFAAVKDQFGELDRLGRVDGPAIFLFESECRTVEKTLWRGSVV